MEKPKEKDAQEQREGQVRKMKEAIRSRLERINKRKFKNILRR